MQNFGGTPWEYILASPGGGTWGTKLTLAGIVGPLWSPETLVSSWGAPRGKAACMPHFCPPSVLAPPQHLTAGPSPSLHPSRVLVAGVQHVPFSVPVSLSPVGLEWALGTCFPFLLLISTHQALHPLPASRTDHN